MNLSGMSTRGCWLITSREVPTETPVHEQCQLCKKPVGSFDEYFTCVKMHCSNNRGGGDGRGGQRQ